MLYRSAPTGQSLVDVAGIHFPGVPNAGAERGDREAVVGGVAVVSAPLLDA